jgi:hypothetical protein
MLRKSGLAGWALAAMLSVAGPAAVAHADLFGDDFARPDGGVGNGWGSWVGMQLGDPRVVIRSAEVEVPSVDILSGGIFRAQPFAFPARFRFDFRTGDPTSGWMIAFNAVTPSVAPFYPPFTPGQITFVHPAGWSNLQRVWERPGQLIGYDEAPGQAEPIPGLRGYRPDVAATIEGYVAADLSATVTITYNDGVLPASVTLTFGPAVDTLTPVPGGTFMLGTSAGAGVLDPLAPPPLSYFDNLVVSTSPGGGAEPAPLALVVGLDVKPGNDRDVVNGDLRGKVRVALLSTAGFGAPDEVDQTTLRFGRLGVEPTIEFCRYQDVSHDGRTDLVCWASLLPGSLAAGDPVVLTGRTVAGVPLRGQATLTLAPPADEDDRDGACERRDRDAGDLGRGGHDADDRGRGRHDRDDRDDGDRGRGRRDGDGRDRDHDGGDRDHHRGRGHGDDGRDDGHDHHGSRSERGSRR